MRQGGLVLAVGRVRSKKRKRKKRDEISPNTKKHSTKYIHSSSATATTSRRRAVEHVPLGSPSSHSSSVDPGFVEIGLACIHTYVCTRTAAVAPPVYALVLYFLASAASSFSSVILVCISGFGVVRWCMTLSFLSAHGITRIDVNCCVRGVFCGASYSREHRAVA